MICEVFMDKKEEELYMSENDKLPEKPIYVIGKSFPHDSSGRPTKEGWNELSNTLSVFSDKRFETARYIMVKDGRIIRHIGVSSCSPSSTIIQPDDDFIFSLRNYAEKTDSKVIFIHNHPSGDIRPSENDITLTKKLENNFIDNEGVNRFCGHIILDHGNYGLYLPETGWKSLIDGKIQDIGNMSGVYVESTSLYGIKIKGENDLLLLAAKADQLDDGISWNRTNWIPAWFATPKGLVKNLEYINISEFNDVPLLKTKIRSLGRDSRSEFIYLTPANLEQNLICESFAQTTGMVRDVCLLKDDGYDFSKYSGGNIFEEVLKNEITIDDTDKYGKEIVDEKIDFEINSEQKNNMISKENNMEKNKEQGKFGDRLIFNRNKVEFKDLTPEQNLEREKLYDEVSFKNTAGENSEFMNIMNYFDFANHRDEEILFLRAAKDIGGDIIRDSEGMSKAVEQYLCSKFDVPQSYKDGEHLTYSKEEFDSFKQKFNFINFAAFDIVHGRKEALKNKNIETPEIFEEFFKAQFREPVSQEETLSAKEFNKAVADEIEKMEKENVSVNNENKKVIKENNIMKNYFNELSVKLGLKDDGAFNQFYNNLSLDNKDLCDYKEMGSTENNPFASQELKMFKNKCDAVYYPKTNTYHICIFGDERSDYYFDKDFKPMTEETFDAANPINIETINEGKHINTIEFLSHLKSKELSFKAIEVVDYSEFAGMPKASYYTVKDNTKDPPLLETFVSDENGNILNSALEKQNFIDNNRHNLVDFFDHNKNNQIKLPSYVNDFVNKINNEFLSKKDFNLGTEVKNISKQAVEFSNFIKSNYIRNKEKQNTKQTNEISYQTFQKKSKSKDVANTEDKSESTQEKLHEPEASESSQNISEPVIDKTKDNKMEILQEQLKRVMDKLDKVIQENNELRKENELLRENGKNIQNPQEAHEYNSSSEKSNYNKRSMEPNSFTREKAFIANAKVPPFGRLVDGKIEILKDCRFQERLEHEWDNTQNKVILIHPEKDGKNTKIEMSELDYYKIINNYEELEKTKNSVTQDSFEWIKAHENYNKNLLLDEHKYRINTTENFHHNFKVRCSINKPRNPEDAILEAKQIIDGMSKYEKSKFNKMRHEMGSEKFDRMLINEFTLNVGERDMDKATFKTEGVNEIYYDANKELTELPVGAKIGKTDFKVGDSITMAIRTKGWNGKVRKTPASDFKIVKVSKDFVPNRAIVYSEKSKASYLLPLDELERQIVRSQKQKTKEEKRQIAKDDKLYGYEGRS